MIVQGARFVGRIPPAGDRGDRGDRGDMGSTSPIAFGANSILNRIGLLTIIPDTSINHRQYIYCSNV